MRSLLQAKLLGDFALSYNGEPILRAHAPRLQSLLAYLILHRDAPQPRHRLAYLFWPDSSEAQARTNLRRELHTLRLVLPEADRYLLADHQVLQWRADAPQSVDLRDFEDAVAGARQALQENDDDLARRSLEQALAAYGGDLLPDCYDEWIEPERERLRADYLWALEQLSANLEDAGRYAEAARAVERLLLFDPTRDVAVRSLMRLHLLRGDRAAALQAYHTFAERLRREIGVEPDPETRAAFELARRSDDRRARPLPIDRSNRLVGRAVERRALLQAWRHAAEGHSHLLLIEGEAGIGKSRLVEELRTWASRQGIATAAARSYAAEGEYAYAPMIEWLRSDPLRRALAALDDASLAEVGRLSPDLLGGRADLQWAHAGVNGSERRLAEALVQVIRAVDRPLLLVLDDLQWTDRETLGWLRFLFNHEPSLRLLIAGTMRRDEVDEDHPVVSLALELSRGDRITRIELGPLEDDESEQLASAVAGRSLTPEQASIVVRESEGNPLFIVEMIRSGLPASTEHDVDPAGNPRLPPKVTAVIAARLAQLSAPARELAGLAATIGRDFSLDVLLAASGADDRTVVAALEELVSRHIVRERTPTLYDFSHDKLRDVAYAGISSARRQLYHRQVARALETVHAHDLESISAQLAAHARLGGLLERAVRFYEAASERSLRLSAYHDAIAQIQQGLQLLATLPPSDQRAQQEARLYTVLGVALMATKGWPTSEVGEAYRRAQLLYESSGDAGHYSRLIWGLWGFHVVRGELAIARRLAEQTVALAAALGDRALRLVGDVHVGSVQFHQGELSSARTHLEQAVAGYDPAQHRDHASQFGPDLGVFSLGYLSHVLWHLGHPERAISSSSRSLELARERAHPYSQAIALAYAAMLAQFLGERDQVYRLATEAAELCRKHDFAYYLAWCSILRDWAAPESELREPRPVAMQRGLSMIREIGAGLRLPYYSALLAESHLEAGDLEPAGEALAVAWTSLRQGGERHWEAELNRIQASLMAARGTSATAVEQRLREALAVSRRQGARSLALRAATQLSRRLVDRRRRGEAMRLLRDEFDHVDAGFDTHDVREARELLYRLTTND